MKRHDPDPVRSMHEHLDQIEALADDLEEIACILRDAHKHVDANQLMETIRAQRFQAMLIRGQLLSW